MGCDRTWRIQRRSALLAVLVETESGSTYEFEGNRVRRVNESANKRGDTEWQPLVTMFPKTPTVGYPMLLVLKSLVRYGGDDHGTPPDRADEVTTRRTTTVTNVSGSPIDLPSIAQSPRSEL